MIAERFAQAVTEFRDVTLTDSYDALSQIFGGGRTVAGAHVNNTTALTVSAYYAGVKILAETMGSMRCEVMRELVNEDDNEYGRLAVPARDSRLWRLLYEQPNPEMPANYFWELLTTHVGLRGNGYGYKQRDEYGRVIAIWPIPPHHVEVQRDPLTRRKLFLVSVDSEDPVRYEFVADDIIHFRGFGPDPLRGLSPITALRELLGRGIAEQEYQSALMRNQARPSGVLQTDNKIDAKKGRIIARRVKRATGGYRNAGEIVVLEQGLKWQQTALSAGDLQFIQQREFTTKDMARVLRIPADMLLVETGGSMHYTSDETVPLRFLTFSMMPWMRRFEGPLGIDQDLPWAMTGPKPGRTFPRFQPDDLLRVDRKTRFEAWASALDKGWMTPDEVRIRESLVPLGLNKTKPLDSPKPTPASTRNNGTDPEVDPDDVERLLDNVLA